MALTIWGRQAAGGPYAAISALTNIPATVLAFFLYNTLLGSSSKSTYMMIFSPRGAEKRSLTRICTGSIALTSQHLAFLKARHMYHEDNGLVPTGQLPALESPSRSFDEKIGNTRLEHAGNV
jgi:hypothetical protein